MFPFCPIPVLRRSVLLAALLGLALVEGCGGGGSNPPLVPPVAVAPIIVTQPASLTVTAPQPASFTVVASGTGPLHYQWQKSGAPVGADADTLTLASTSLSDTAPCYVTVSNAAGSVNSLIVFLTVHAAPVFITQPAPQSVIAPAAATFNAAVNGAPLPTVQWQRSNDSGVTWTDLIGATSPSYTTTATAVTDSGSQFRVVATNNVGTLNSLAATLTVLAVPPSGLTYTAGTATYTRSVAITPNVPSNGGGAVNSYSVSPSLPAGLNLSTSTGVISGTPTTVAASASYTVTATNSGGSTTASLTITVNNPPDVAPAFTTQPTNQAVTTPAAATFTAVVSGSPTPTLQWQRSTNGGTSWVDLASSTFSGYTTPATTGADNGTQFRLVATNTLGSLASNAVTLTVASLGKTWQAAGPVGPNSGGIYEPPQIGFDGQGNALAIWTQDTVGVPQRDLWANRYVAGTGWGTAQIIFPGVGTRVNRAQLGVDATGKALVVWALDDDPYNPMRRIWSISFDPGTGWGTATGIDNDSGSSTSGSPKLAVGANGSAVALWTQGDSLSSMLNVCMLTGSTTTGWGGSPSVVATGPIGVAGAVGAPDVILNAQGAGFAFWQCYNGTNFLLTAAPIAAGAAGAGQIVATAAYFYNPHAAINAAGTVVVVWGQYGGSRLGIFSSHYLSGSGWGSPAQVNSLGWTVFNQTPDPQVVLDDAGLATALWVEGTGASSPTVWNHQTATGWGIPEIISYSNSGYRLTGNGAGQLLGTRFSGQNLYGSPNYLAISADWGAGTLLTSTGYIPMALTMDASGNGLAVWIQPVTGGYALAGSVYR